MQQPFMAVNQGIQPEANGIYIYNEKSQLQLFNRKTCKCKKNKKKKTASICSIFFCSGVQQQHVAAELNFSVGL